MAKKSFINTDNPALQFISGAAAEENPPQEAAPGGAKPNPAFVETKNRRVQLVFQPSLYKKVREKAKAGGLSVNEYIHQILDEATRGK